MKKIILLLVCLSPVIVFAQNDFTITSKMSGKGHPQMAYLLYTRYQQNEPHKVARQEKQIIDSSEIRNGAFRFKGTITDPVVATMKIRYRGDTSSAANENDISVRFINGAYRLTHNTCLNDKISFMLGAGPISFVAADSLKHARISGPKVATDYNELMAIMNPLQSDWNRLQSRTYEIQGQRSGDTALVKLMTDSTNKADKKLRMAEHKFAQTHVDSYAGLWALNDVLHNWRNYWIDSPRKYFEKFSAEVRATKLGQEYENRFRTEDEYLRLKLKHAPDSTLLGKKMDDFKQPDIKGRSFTLSSLRGKYVLIDFWASWCGPCLAEIPNLAKAYRMLKDKNLEIVGISMDKDAKDWRAAVKNNGMTWIHVSDLQGLNNAVSSKLKIGIIPQNFLIDPNGVIIGMKIFGEDTAQQLAKLMKLE